MTNIHPNATRDMDDIGAYHFEWAVKLEWPDGHVEYRVHSRMTGKPYTRRDAEVCVEATGHDLTTEAEATLVRRDVWIGDWVSVSAGQGGV